jgi:phosphatidylglycerophosphate synthase
MKTATVLPAAISFSRIPLLLLFVWTFSLGNVGANVAILAVVIASDLLDGYLARKLKVNSMLGGYLDALTDFIFVLGVFTLFSSVNLSPFWMPVLIALSFWVFIMTSLFGKILYDPIGKYLGSALYFGIFVSVLFPISQVGYFVVLAFSILVLMSLLSRTLSLIRNRKK